MDLSDATSSLTSPPRGGFDGLAVERVGKAYPGTGEAPAFTLSDVSLRIPPRGVFTLLGPSGCGKTTLLRLIAGFETPDSGDIRLDGRSITADPPNRRPVNTVFQSYALFPHMNVAENIAFGLRRRGLTGAAVRTRVDAMAALVRLQGLEERRPSQLSGGQQQRVALARALAPAPKLLLLDEPLSALDAKLRDEMRHELKRIQRETGIAFLFVTHDQEEALALSDEIAVMKSGRVEQIGAPQTVYARPATRFVAEFMGANVVPGALVGSAAPFAAIRPEHVVLAEDGLAGRILEVTYRGARHSCRVALAGGEMLRVETTVPAPPEGAHVFCRIAPADIVALAP